MKRPCSIQRGFIALLICPIFGPAMVCLADVSIVQSVEILRRSRGKKTAAVEEVLAKAAAKPDYRTELIRQLSVSLGAYQEDYRGAREIQALRLLGAVEELPALQARWRKTAKKVHYLERGDPRIQLLHAISEFLPEARRIQFLIEAQKDPHEAPKVRFRATILLCAGGSDRGIEHVVSAYEQAQKTWAKTVRMSAKDQARYLREQGTREDNEKNAWDKDMDFMTDYAERGMLLDASSRDTDGDGLLDGNDRNPLCAPKDKNSDQADIASCLFWLHTTYGKSRQGPFPFPVWIARTTDHYETPANPSIFDGLELTGIEGIVLHMSPEQIERYRALHGYSTPMIGIHELNDSQKQINLSLLGEEAGSDESMRWFSFSEYIAPEGAAWWLVGVKKINGVWLPVFWKMTMIS